MTPARLLSYARRPQALALAGNLTVSALSVVSVSLLFRALPLREAGMWIFFNSTVGLADAFRAGFLTTAFIRAYAGATPARAAEVAGSAWNIALLITVALVALNGLGWLLLPHPSEEMALLLRWFGLVLLATLPYFMATCLLQAQVRFDRILVIRLLSQGVFVGGVVVLMLLHRVSLGRVVYCYVGAQALTSLLALALGWAQPGQLARRSVACTRELAHFGKFSVGSYVGSFLLRSSDTFLINFWLGPAPLAVYNLAARFMEIIEIPLRSLLATAMPVLSAAFNRQRLDEVSLLLRRNAGLLTWVFVPVVLSVLLLADVPVYLIGGAKFAHTAAANILRFNIVLALVYPLDRFNGVTLDVVNQPRINLLKVLLMLAINVAGDTLALWRTGSLYGVVLASYPTVLIGFAFGYLHLRRHLPGLTLRSIVVTGWHEVRRLARW